MVDSRLERYESDRIFLRIRQCRLNLVQLPTVLYPFSFQATAWKISALQICLVWVGTGIVCMLPHWALPFLQLHSSSRIPPFLIRTSVYFTLILHPVSPIYLFTLAEPLNMDVEDVWGIDQWMQLLARQKVALKNASKRKGEQPKDKKNLSLLVSQQMASHANIASMKNGKQNTNMIYQSFVPPPYYPLYCAARETQEDISQGFKIADSPYGWFPFTSSNYSSCGDDGSHGYTGR